MGVRKVSIALWHFRSLVCFQPFKLLLMCGLAACGVIFLGFPDRYNFHHKDNWLVSTELPLWRPCSIQQSELVVQLAHLTQPWDGTQLLHMRFGSHKFCHFVICQYLLSTNYIYIADPWLLPWAKKTSLCTYDLGLPRGFCIMSIWIIYIFSHNQGDQVSGSQKLWPTVLLFWPHEDPQVLFIHRWKALDPVFSFEKK